MLHLLTWEGQERTDRDLHHAGGLVHQIDGHDHHPDVGLGHQLGVGPGHQLGADLDPLAVIVLHVVEVVPHEAIGADHPVQGVRVGPRGSKARLSSLKMPQKRMPSKF